MAKVNQNFDNLVPNYLFAEIAKRVNRYVAEHPDNHLIRLGIGDVTLPLAPVVVEAMKKGCDELGCKETFKGYPDYEGYEFLREAISGYYKRFGVTVDPDEIMVNDGAKSDAGNMGDIFSKDNIVLVTDPVYPVYVDANIMSGRKIIYADATPENGFCALPDPSVHADMIYLCSPNNPTGAAYTTEQLKAWVDYANENDAVIFYDAAYEAFITQDDVPRSIFAIEGARTCAIEMCSLSKTAGFTGTRCGYTVIPKELERDGKNIYQLWYRREATKFNGVSYPVQCAAAAVFSELGLHQIKENLSYYQENARVIAQTLDELRIPYTGGINSPYIWLQCPNGMGSWEFFDCLLHEIEVVGTPGEGFGKNGAGWFRLTSFGDKDKTIEAMERLKQMLKK
ncbi:lL-diaminopimelate aminotransferase [Ruminococcus sp. CAG:379]|uniref:LL-diaminopimelate aminotransferase n=2 Tax=Oscillospiraceae TaxID=216572 RepID=UPI00033C294E|nr:MULTISPECIES: LL-diaminopimelate aminotransferase [Ruminococcus]CDD53446.1 lL-diaminopimelate aminotransferase [Ruminococcus sp. CAG:379]